MAERFYSTGVTSVQDFKFWFGGGNQNVLRMIQVLGGGDPSANYFQEWDLDLERLRPNPVNATPYGIISSGSVWASDIADTIAMPSTDGWVYGLWWLSCIDTMSSMRKLQEGSADFAAPAVHPFDAERRAMLAAGNGNTFVVDQKARAGLIGTPEAREALLRQAARDSGRAGGESAADAAGSAPPFKDPFPTCVQWAFGLGKNGSNPSLSPSRYAVPSPPGVLPIVLVSESNPDIDTGGVLHCLNANTGVELWNFAAVDDNAVSWGLTGVVPVVDSSRGNMIFLAYGPYVVALDANSGNVVAALDSASFPEPVDPNEYIYASGAFDSGTDIIALQNMSYTDSTARCTSDPVCKGFWFRNGQGFDWQDPYTIDPNAFVHFVSSTTFTPAPAQFRYASFRKPGFGVDPFVSSPVLSSQKDALFVHSASGTLWRINIVGAPYPGQLSLVPAWACDYLVDPPSNYTQCVGFSQARKASFPAPVYREDPAGGPAVVPGNVAAGEVVHRGDYVAGGWPQPTTLAQRDELYAAMRDRFLSTHSEEQLREARALHPELAALAADSRPTIAQAAAMMRVFRAAGRAFEVHSMRTASGYVRLDGASGAPVDVAYAAMLEASRAKGGEAAAPAAAAAAAAAPSRSLSRWRWRSSSAAAPGTAPSSIAAPHPGASTCVAMRVR